jgi:uncharacterized tellurite resistance protein B-like protein
MATRFEELDEDDRLRLLRFVCSFAWADLQVADAERGFVHRLFEQLSLTADEQHAVEGWLRLPPPPEEVDPTDIPAEHRQLFLDYALRTVGADGHLSEQELETLSLFESLLPG